MIKTFLILLFPVLLLSQTISSVTGTISNGETLTISGSSFGTKSTAAPLISSYDNATSATNFSTGSISGTWHTQGSPALSATSPRSDLYQSDYKISYDASGAYDVIGYNHSSGSNVTYLSWWVYRDYTVWRGANADGNAKFMRLYTGSTADEGAGNGLVFSTEWTGGSSPYVLSKTYCQPEYAPSCAGWSIAYTGTNATQSASAYLKVNFQDGDAALQEWEHYELYQIYSTNLENSEDTSILLKDGETIYRTNNVSLQTSSSADDQRNIRLGQVSGSRSETQMEYIDQIYFDNTVAHVFISDASNLTSFTDNATAHHNETQVCSSWATGEISFTLNQGSFANASTVYVYVVDASGNISNGSEILLGDSSADDTTSPVITLNFIEVGTDSGKITASTSSDTDTIKIATPDSSTIILTQSGSASIDTTIEATGAGLHTCFAWAIDNSSNITYFDDNIASFTRTGSGGGSTIDTLIFKKE